MAREFKEQRNETARLVGNFMRAMLKDDEVLAGGIGKNEAYYLEQLGWDDDSEEARTFFTAMCSLVTLIREDTRKKLNQ